MSGVWGSWLLPSLSYGKCLTGAFHLRFPSHSFSPSLSSPSLSLHLGFHWIWNNSRAFLSDQTHLHVGISRKVKLGLKFLFVALIRLKTNQLTNQPGLKTPLEGRQWEPFHDHHFPSARDTPSSVNAGALHHKPRVVETVSTVIPCWLPILRQCWEPYFKYRWTSVCVCTW